MKQFVVLCLVLSAWLCLGEVIAGEELRFEWLGSQNISRWKDPENWDVKGGSEGTKYTPCVTNETKSIISVTINSTEEIILDDECVVSSLSIANAHLSGNGSLVIDENFRWTLGRLSLSSVLLKGNGTIEDKVYINSTRFVNSGALGVEGVVVLEGLAEITNNGLLALRNSTIMNGDVIDQYQELTNHGNATVSEHSTIIGLNVTNTGDFEITEGCQLVVNNSTLNNTEPHSNIIAHDRAILDLYFSHFTNDGSVSISGSAVVSVFEGGSFAQTAGSTIIRQLEDHKSNNCPLYVADVLSIKNSVVTLVGPTCVIAGTFNNGEHGTLFIDQGTPVGGKNTTTVIWGDYTQDSDSAVLSLKVNAPPQMRHEPNLSAFPALDVQGHMSITNGSIALADLFAQDDTGSHQLPVHAVHLFPIITSSQPLDIARDPDFLDLPTLPPSGKYVVDVVNSTAFITPVYNDLSLSIESGDNMNLTAGQLNITAKVIFLNTSEPAPGVQVFFAILNVDNLEQGIDLVFDNHTSAAGTANAALKLSNGCCQNTTTLRIKASIVYCVVDNIGVCEHEFSEIVIGQKPDVVKKRTGLLVVVGLTLACVVAFVIGFAVYTYLQRKRRAQIMYQRLGLR